MKAMTGGRDDNLTDPGQYRLRTARIDHKVRMKQKPVPAPVKSILVRPDNRRSGICQVDKTIWPAS